MGAGGQARKPEGVEKEVVPMEAFVSTLIGVVAGTIATVLVSRHYYKKASQDLVIESAALRKLTEMMLGAMEQAGLAKFYRDSKGKIDGMLITLSVHNAYHPTGNSPVKTKEPGPV